MRIRHRQAMRQVLLLVGIATVILTSAPDLVETADVKPTVRQRFVPASRPELWPSNPGSDWVPVRRTELDELLQRIRSRSENQQTIPFNTATYSGEFDPRKLSISQGSATLIVSSSQTPGSLVRCSPLNLSIDGPRWKDSSVPAVLGANTDGDHYLVIPPDSRDLQFDWQLTGTRRLSGVEFAVRVPSAVASVLSLKAPQGWTLTASSGSVTSGQNNDGGTTWRLDLGRRTETLLRLVEPGQNFAKQDVSLTTASVSSRFELTPLVVNSTTDVSFESLATTADSIELQIAEAWQIRSVERVSGGAVPWHDLGLADGLRRLRIELPDGAVATERGFVISTSLPIDLAADLQLAPPRLVDAVLFDGRLQVALNPPFTLQDYHTVGLSQTDVSAESGYGGRTLLSFQQFAPDAYVRVSLRDDASNRDRLLSIREFVVGRFDLDPPEFHADLQIAARSPEFFSLNTWIPQGWEVTRVTHRGPAGLQVELPWQAIQARTDGPDLVQISLPDGLETGRPVLLQISAQHITWTRGSVRAVPAVFPDVNALTSVTAGLLFTSPDDASDMQIEGFERLGQDAGLSRSGWSPIAGELAGQPVSLHTLDYWEDAESRARQTLRRQGTGSTDTTPQPASDSSSGAADSDKPTGIGTNTVQEIDNSKVESDSLSSEDTADGDVTHPIVTSRLESYISPGSGGRDVHRMSWMFAYSAPAQTLTLRLPQEAVLLETLWNDQSLAASADGQNWSIPVPKTASGDTLTVSYTLHSKAIYLWDTQRVALPAFDAINASFEWVLRLRKGYSVVSLSEEMTRINAGRSAGWLRWFFGPLARSQSTDWFNPISADSWKRVLQSDGSSTNDTAMPARDAAVIDPNQQNRDWITVRSISGAVPRTLSIHVCRIDRLHALAWFVLIATCLVGVTLRMLQAGSRNRIGLFWLSGCLVAAVIVPSSYSELVGAAILGTVIATLFPRSLIRPQPETTVDSYPSMSSTIALPRARVSELLKLLLLAGTLVGATQAVAQNGEPAIPAEVDILVPYPGERLDRSASLPEVVYVDATTLRRLQQADEVATGTPSVLLSRTEWVAIVDRDDRSTVQGRLTVAVADSSTTVIPVPVPASLVDPETPVLLDGQPVSTLPGPDGKSLLVPLPQARSSSSSVQKEAQADQLPGRTAPVLENDTAASPTVADSKPRAAAPSLPEVAAAQNVVTQPASRGWTLHTLELRLRPETRTEGDLRRFVFPVSPVAQSQFRLKFEVAPATVHDGRTGAPVIMEDRTVALQPGPDREVTLDWSATLAQTSSSSLSVEIHSAAEIYPGRILRQTLARCVPAEGSRVSRLAWRLPKHIRLDRQQIRAPGLVDSATQVQADHTLVLLEFDPPHLAPFTVQLNWQQISAGSSDPSDIQWESPVSVIGAPLRVSVNGHLAGLKAAPGFRLPDELLLSLEQSRVSSESFLEPWPENTRPRSPQIAVHLPDRDRLPIAAQILPIQAQRAVRQNLEARIAQSGIRWTISAEIETSNAPAFLHEVLIPEVVHIDSVSLQQDEVDRLSHWERRDDRLVLFLRDRSTGIQTVTIEGHQQFDRKQPVPVPAIAVRDSQLLSNTLQAYSQPGIRPVIRGAEAIDDAPSEAGPATVSPSGFFGQYRIPSGSDVSLELQAASDSTPLRWLGIVDLIDDEHPAVELAIVLAAQDTGQWRITLPDWTTAQIEILSVNGNTDDSVSEPFSAVLEGQTLTLSVSASELSTNDIRLRLPVDPSLLTRIESGQPVPLVPPVCEQQDDVPAAIVARRGGERLGITGRLVSDLKLQQFKELIAESVNQSALLSWDASSEVTVKPETTSVLPSLALHTIRCGSRLTQICQTRVLVNSDVKQLRVRWPESVQEVYRRIDGQLRKAGSSHGSGGSENPLEVIELDDSGSVHQLEFLWKPAASSRPLKIRRESLEFPRITAESHIEQFVEVVPAADVNILPDGSTDLSRTDQETILSRLSPWYEHSKRSNATLPNHIQRTLDAMLRTTQSDTLVTDNLAITESDQLPLQPDLSTDTESSQDRTLSTLNRKPLLLLPSGGDEVGVWLVDRNVDLALLGVAVGLAVILPILKFFSLEFGERLAGRPMLSFILIGLVWWLCLQGSAAGFGVLVLAAVFWTVQSTVRRVPRQSTRRPALR